jgi:hypothetical protein
LHTGKRSVILLNWFWIIILVLAALWILGLATHFLGGLINILIVVALVLAIIWLVRRVGTKK